MALFRCASGGGGGGQITVTYDSDFYGETITCTRGQKVYSKVASSSGSVVFVVNEEGDWLIECTMGGDTYSTTASVEFTASAELVAIPDGETVTPTDDVETWLLCAGIRDKSYTTLSEVLADSETFNALLGDSNACAYMARSTTFASTLCADQYAMSMIGQYDVCCDALLGNATWASAIANSTYWDYIVEGIVPTMTSDTSPSGTVSYISQLSGCEGYRAFNGNTNVGWLASSGYFKLNDWLAYKFDAKKTIVKALVGYSFTSSSTVYFKVQGSDDDFASDIHDLCSEQSISGSSQYKSVLITLSSISDYQSYRIIATRNISTAAGNGFTVQFYGHASSGEYIHGTNDEVAYYLDGASETPIVDPSTLSAGTYTFGSTVAKDPSDLTADYTKTIRITPNTKEIVLRPDNALYWWGVMLSGCEDVSAANGWNMNSMSMIAPTKNIGSIALSTNGANDISGIGSKYAITGSTLNAIGNTTSGTNTFIESVLAKGLNNPVYTQLTSTMSKFTLDISLRPNYYVDLLTYGASNSSTLYALWYE